MYKRITVFFLFIFSLTYGQNAGTEIVKINNGEVTTLEGLLQKYIQIPSVSGDEKKAGDFIKSVCRENGLIITSFGDTDNNYNFAASVFPLSEMKPNIVLLNHIDVVPESNTCEYGPFSGVEKDGNIYGRGAIDNKGAAIMQLGGILKYLKDYKGQDSKYNITFLAVSCEETQCSGGVNYVIEHYLDLLNPVLVIGEGPTELSTLMEGDFKNPIFGVSVAHKRTLWLHLEVEMHGIGHGSVTPLNYANKEMIEALDRLLKRKPKVHFNKVNMGILKTIAGHKKGIEKLILNNPRFFRPILVPKLRREPKLFSIFSNTMTVTNINSNNTAFNIIPDKVEAYLDCRLLPDEDEHRFIAKIKKELKNDSIKISIAENLPRTKPSRTDNIYFVNLSKAIQMNYPKSQVVPVMMPNVNDLGSFRSKGITAYASIPVYLKMHQVENIHNTDESIPVKAIYDGSRVFYNFLQLMNSR